METLAGAVPAPLPPNEIERLAELESYEILDTLPEEAYEAITFLASQICEAPIALISLVDENRQWFKSRVGLEATETPRDLAFCAHAILEPDDVLIVEDATNDARFATNPLVVHDPSIRFYAGAPLVTGRGNALGTLCVIGREPRKLTFDQERALRSLAVQVMSLLELRWTVDELHGRQTQLEEVMRQREALIAAVSHEIRTPLTAVVGYVDMLVELGPSLSQEERHEMLDQVGRQASDVQHLIEDLLVAARAEAGSLDVTTEPVELADVVKHVLESLDRDQANSVSVAVEAGTVIGDGARIRQIVRNLLTNAFRYGGPEVRVETTCHATSACIAVRDNGDGVPEAEVETIFEPYGRASNARPVAGSVGLGLSISRELAHRMGGSLEYRRANGVSTFELSLPLLRSA